MSSALKLLPALLFFATTAVADPVRLARHAVPSPDGQRVAFSWRGDLFVGPVAGGTAQRLTAHPAQDHSPAWSPDGDRLAFISDRAGNDDVHLMDSRGGGLRQLTFHSRPDWLPAFTSDGAAVVFGSSRQVAFTQEASLWQLSLVNEADPQPLAPFAASSGTPSPDGRFVAFTRGRGSWFRKGYRGAGDINVWLWDTETGATRQLTTHDGYDDWPTWLSADEIVYRSDSDGTFNLWSVDVRTGRRRQLTDFDGDGVVRPRAGGGRVAFEVLDRLMIWDRTTGTRELVFEAPADTAVPQVLNASFTGQASDLALSRDGKLMAHVLRGEVHVSEAAKEPVEKTAARVTHSPARDRQPSWLPDGESLVFSSDRSGTYDLFRAAPREGDDGGPARALAFDVEQLTEGPDEDVLPRVSPTGEHVAFRRGRGDLGVLDLKRGDVRIVSAGSNLGDVRWSPDGAWLAFSRYDDEFNEDVWIIAADGASPPVNVSRHPDDDSAPRWSANGRSLVYRARRQGNDDRIALIFLRADDFGRAAPELEEAWKAAAKKPGKDADEKKGGAKRAKDAAPALRPVRIDWDGLHERTRVLVAMPGATDLAPAPDGLRIAFGARGLDGKSDLWTVGWDGDERKRLTKGGQSPRAMTWSSDGKSITYLASGGKVKRVAAKGGSPDNLPFRSRFDVDLVTEREHVFEEAWRLLRDNFYDDDFHGRDWQALRDKYAPLAAAAVTRQDFQDVVRRLMGELNASHLGISGGGEPNADAVATGETGALFEPAVSGDGLRVRHVVADSPLARLDPPVGPGDVLIAVDDTPVTASTRIHRLLTNREGERVRLTFRGPEEMRPDRPRQSRRERRRPREVIVRPIAARELNRLLYEEWIARRRELTESWSGGRVGYLHVRSMGSSSLERFEQELYSVGHGKEAIVIDVRNNGGGWTTDMMLAMLMVKPHAITVPRGGGPGYPEDRRPLYAWSKPVATLCNQYSFSNAEIFSHAMKTLGRGPVVGVATHGSVISTGGTRLLDGSWLRLPFRGWYVAGSGDNMEGTGAEPDHVVHQTPDDERDGRDPQLQRAVGLLVTSLGASG